MYNGSPPFYSATDDIYRLLKTKKYKYFWAAHSKQKPKNFFSEQFKDLFIKLVSANPDDRPSIQEIASHPWVSGDTCTHSEVKTEFTARQQKINKVK